MFERAKRNHKEVESVFSLINIIFLLIVFFIVAGHVSNDDFDISPPKAQNSNALAEDNNCSIQVSSKSAMYKNQNIMNNPELIKEISNKCEHKILLVADKNLDAIQVVTVMNEINIYFKQIKLLVMSDQ
jgi:biopolymer transport protein ExbD